MSDEIRRELKAIRESQERLADWLGAIGALLTKLAEQERARFEKLDKAGEVKP